MLTVHIQRLSPDLTRGAPKRGEQHFNPFVPNALFLYPLKVLENLTISDVFSG